MTPRRILIVDDEETVALTLQAGLERLPGCLVTVATSGEQAVQQLQSAPIDLLVTDYKMPGMNGLELVALARKLQPRIAIIIVTGYGSPELCAQAEKQAVGAVLEKPVGLPEIRRVALQALDRTLLA